MEVRLNPSKEQYIPLLNKVFDGCEDLNLEMEASIASKSNQGNFLFQVEGKNTAFASTFTSAWHPYCIYVRLAYEWKTEDFLSIKEVVEYLKKTYQKPLFFLLDDRFCVLRKVLDEKDFELIRETEIVRIKPVNVLKGSGGLLRTVSEIKGEASLENSFVKLCKRLYTETHMDNPVAELPDKKWRSAIFDGLLEKYSYVVELDGSIIGFSLVYEPDPVGWELGWLGVEDVERMDLLEGMLNEQLRNAFEEGVAFIEKEIDSTCPYSLHLKQITNYEVMETLFSYRST
ncbi:hypothetical protein [Sporosarcina sp. Te-1]|uniref:hypothetical protein n=1 Tax=Sporosarcina sp. Te-1 TaxID=2818390 RepID=UPI001A9FE0E9|nr:hypothetical protein [Sporosarcina sp. Te-1]QTD42567.1 hypothetical protein J3U78_07115 [Sporosarcina sp. Te-1]